MIENSIRDEATKKVLKEGLEKGLERGTEQSKNYNVPVSMDI